MVVEANLPTIGTIVITGFIDSINPCAIGVLILLLSTLVVIGKSKQKILVLGLTYIGAVYTVYFLAGLGLTMFLHSIPLVLTQYISITVGMLVVVGGIIEIKDFFWYGKGFSLAISPEHAKKIHELSKRITFPSLLFLGAFVAAVELPCTGGPYLAITLILSQNFSTTAVLLLAFYNVLFVLPLVIILMLVYFGTKLHTIKMWKHTNKHFMRLAIGIILVYLGWLLILIANGTINLG
jgi:cytochrome c biogenesis protein CcdA